MRRLLPLATFVILLFWPRLSLAQTWSNTSGTSTSCSATFAAGAQTPSTNQFLAVFATCVGTTTNPTSITVADTQTNTWVASPENTGASCTSGGNGCTDRFYAISKNANATTVTATIGSAGSGTCGCIMVFSKCTNAAGGNCPTAATIDVHANNHATGSPSNTGLTGTTSNAFELVLGSISQGAAQAPLSGPVCQGSATCTPQSINNATIGSMAQFTGSGALTSTGTTELQWSNNSTFWVGAGDTFQVAQAVATPTATPTAKPVIYENMPYYPGTAIQPGFDH